MPLYMITYDLTHKPPEVYESLNKALEDAYAQRAQDSVWLLDSPHSAQKNFDWFNKHLKPGDQMLVTEIDIKNSWTTKYSDTWSAFEWISMMKKLLALATRSLTAESTKAK